MAVARLQRLIEALLRLTLDTPEPPKEVVYELA